MHFVFFKLKYEIFNLLQLKGVPMCVQCRDELIVVGESAVGERIFFLKPSKNQRTYIMGTHS